MCIINVYIDIDKMFISDKKKNVLNARKRFIIRFSVHAARIFQNVLIEKEFKKKICIGIFPEENIIKIVSSTYD